MKNFKEDLHTECKINREYRNIKKEYKAEESILEKLNVLLKESQSYLHNDLSIMIEKVSKRLELLENNSINNGFGTLKEDRNVLSVDFIEKQIKNMKEGASTLFFELVLKGSSEIIAELDEFAKKNNIKKICSNSGEVYHLHKKYQSEIVSYGLTAAQCNLFEKVLEKNEINNSYIGLYAHLEDISNKANEVYVLDENQGFLGIKSDKFIIRLPKSPSDAYQSVREVLSIDLPRALVRNESKLKWYPDQRESSNIYQFLKLIDKIENQSQDIEQKRKTTVKI